MITKIQYNWRQEADGEEKWSAWSECETYEVGKDGVRSIEEKTGIHMLYHCLIIFEDGHRERVLDINKVTTDSEGF